MIKEWNQKKNLKQNRFSPQNQFGIRMIRFEHFWHCTQNCAVVSNPISQYACIHVVHEKSYFHFSSLISNLKTLKKENSDHSHRNSEGTGGVEVGAVKRSGNVKKEEKQKLETKR